MSLAKTDVNALQKAGLVVVTIPACPYCRKAKVRRSHGSNKLISLFSARV